MRSISSFKAGLGCYPPVNSPHPVLDKQLSFKPVSFLNPVLLPGPDLTVAFSLLRRPLGVSALAFPR